MRCPVCGKPDRIVVMTRTNGDVGTHDHEATAVALAADPSRTRHPVAVADRPGRTWADGSVS